MHSTSKYLNGHSDVIGGALVAAPGRPDLGARLAALNKTLGTSQSPQDCFLVLRGLKTLHLRMQAHETNARAVAAFLADQPGVARVNYPGCPATPSTSWRSASSWASALWSASSCGISAATVAAPAAFAALVHAGREPGRGGEPGQPAGDHEPRLHGPRGARAGGHPGRPDPVVRGHRGCRRPRGRSPAGAGRPLRPEACGREETGLSPTPIRSILAQPMAHFRKYHGLGNDYLVIDPRDFPLEPVPEAVRLICDRNFGPGSDGILLGPLQDQWGPHPPHLQPRRQRGREERQWTAHLLLVPPRARLRPGSGVPPPHEGRRCPVQDRRPRRESWCRWTWAGRASMSGPSPRVTGLAEIRGPNVRFGGEACRISCVSMGNPHCVVSGQTVTAELAKRLGPADRVLAPLPGPDQRPVPGDPGP